MNFMLPVIRTGCRASREKSIVQKLFDSYQLFSVTVTDTRKCTQIIIKLLGADHFLKK